MGTINLNREPLRNTFCTLALPAIRALYLTNTDSSDRIPEAPHALSGTDQSCGLSSIEAVNLHGGEAGLELCGELIQLVEHMFDYKTGV